MFVLTVKVNGKDYLPKNSSKNKTAISHVSSKLFVNKLNKPELFMLLQFRYLYRL